MKKRIFGAILCLTLLLSMMASISLPAIAAEEKTMHYFVQSTSDWVKFAEITTNGYWDNAVIHIEKDLDFKGVSVPMFYNGKKFTGTIDGNGFTFSNLTMSTSDQYLGLVYCLGGTIKNLNLSKCTFTINNNSARGGAFVASTASGAVIYKCAAKNVTVTATRGDHLGGLIGTCTSGIKMDSCFFNGAVSGGTGAASALIGYGGNQARVYNSIAMGTMTGGSTGMVRIHANSFAATSGMPIYNSYCIGMNVANYNGKPADYEDAQNTVNGHAYTAAGLEANYKADSAAIAAWMVNKNRVETGLERVYFTVGSSGDLRFGKLKDQAVKLTVISGEATTVSYRGTGDEITLDTIEGKTPVAEGALLENHLLYVDTADITVTYLDTAVYTAAKNREKLQAMYDAYSQMNLIYFAYRSQFESFIADARAALAGNSDAAITEMIGREASLNKSIASTPGYISISQYPVYKYISSFTDYSVGTKQEWLDAVGMSDFSKSSEAFAFDGITIHLTADIDMENTNMLPLCYNGYFKGNLNGHNHIFKNINITVDTSRGPVGLIAQMTGSHWIQNLGIASGQVTVTGSPIYKSGFGISDGGNKAAAFLGKANGNYSFLRRCWNNAHVSIKNRDNSAGLVGDGRSLSYMDGCFNYGNTSGYGLVGYGAAKVKITNSFNAGSNSGAAQYHVNMLGSGAIDQKHLINTFSIGSTLVFTDSDSNLTADQKSARDTFNAAHEVNSAKEAAWRINQNYQHQNRGDGSRIVFTVNSDGYVAFGTEQNRIRRVMMKCEGTADEYLFLAAGSEVELNYDLDANYYALEGEYNQTTLVGRTLKLGNEDVTVRVKRNVNRGDVNGDNLCNLLDAQTVLRQVVGISNTASVENGDANGNAKLDSDDVVLLVRAYLREPGCKFVPGLPDTKDWIKVCSYNIKVMHYEASTGANLPADQMAYKMEEVAQTLKEIDADIVGLQEVDYLASRTGNVDQVKWLAEKLGYPYYHFTSTTGNYGTALMSRFPILKTEDRYFAGNVRENGCRLDGYEPRGYSRNELDVDDDGKTDFLFYNTHLGNFTPQQLQYMSRDLEADVDRGYQLVVTGDFNLWPFEMVGRFNTEKLTALNGGDDFNYFEESTIQEYGNAIDNIMVSDNMDYFWDTARDCGVIEHQSKASDHSPIYSYIKLRGQG